MTTIVGHHRLALCFTIRLVSVLRCFALLVSPLLTATASAQQFGCSWMTYPEPDDTSHVWFRRTFVAAGSGQRPREALLYVATTGRLVVYVNGRSIASSLYVPHRALGDTTAIGLTLDVRRFLRPDTNVVAIAYCPSIRTRHQLSLTLYGMRADGTRFAISGADGWLCRKADSWQTIGGEALDRTAYQFDWTSARQPLALWLAAEDGNDSLIGQPVHNLGQTPSSIFPPSTLTYLPLAADGPVVKNVSQPLLVRQSADSLVYNLPREFHGFVRVTLRDCCAGERILIGNLLYVCSGTVDEQAFARFAPYTGNSLVIRGDRHFRSQQVQNVEVLQTR